MTDTSDDKGFTPESGVSYHPLMLIHWAWLLSPLIPIVGPVTLIFPLVPFFVWNGAKNKYPQAIIHLKNVLNAHFTLMILVVCIWLISRLLGIAPLPSPDNDEFIIMGFIWSVVLLILIHSVWCVAAVAERGRVLPYWWAIRFFKIEP
jgi:uncharacterized Tic20 family protein